MTESPFPEHPVLIVDDEQAALFGCELILETDGIQNAIALGDSRKVMPLLREQKVSCVLLDLSMPHVSGETLLPQITEQHPHLPVIIVTGHNEIDTAIRCMKLGAFDYLVKPVDETRLTTAVRRALELFDIRNEYAAFKEKVLTDTLEHPEAFLGFITRHPKIQRLFQYIDTIAGSCRAVLITGETGVGKEILARAIHAASERKGELVAVNVAALDDTLFSDTLFGHVRGAFSGADNVRAGLIERANDGTLFLDEIGDLEPASQVKLLRLLQENEYTPLGADGARTSSARVVAATNKTIVDLQTSVEFRSDLYFRLETHHVHIPPLRERVEDLPLLVEHFIEKAAADLGKAPPTPPRELVSLLSTYHFPGNVRELEAMIFDAVSHHRSKVMSMETFKAHIARHRQSERYPRVEPGAPPDTSGSPFVFFDRLPTLEQAQTLLIEEALRRSDQNQTVAAALLGITRSGLSKAIKRKRITTSS
jgi:DNA-binding NtrC family response regulator